MKLLSKISKAVAEVVYEELGNYLGKDVVEKVKPHIEKLEKIVIPEQKEGGTEPEQIEKSVKQKRQYKRRFTEEEARQRKIQKTVEAQERKRLDARLDETSHFDSASQYLDWLKAHPSEIFQLSKWAKELKSPKKALIHNFEIDDEDILLGICRYMIKHPKDFALVESAAAKGAWQWDDDLIKRYYKRGRTPAK